MDLDGALMQFPRFRADLDKVMAWIKRQDPTFDFDGAARPGTVAATDPSTQPALRHEVAGIVENLRSDFRTLEARMDERFGAMSNRDDAFDRRLEGLKPTPGTVDPNVRQQTIDPPFASVAPANAAGGASAGQSTEKIDQNAKDGIVRAGSDLNDPSNQNRPAGDQPNPSGAREAMSAQFQAPNLDDGTGPNGRPTVDHATGASAAEVAAATGGSSAPQRAPSGAFPGAGGTDAPFDAAKTAGGGENPAVARPDGHTEGESTGSFVRPPQATPQSSQLEGTFGGNGRPFLENNAERPLGPSPG